MQIVGLVGDVELERQREIDRNQVWLARSNGRMRLRLGEMFEKLVRLQGHRELGFSTTGAYSLERLSRSGRWMGETRTVARRVAELPRAGRAFDRGEYGWCKLELLCRHATAETGVKLLRVARSATVRELRQAFVEGPSEECDPERDAFDRSGIDDTFLAWLCKSYVTTWLPHLGTSDKWEHIYALDLYRCSSPVCFRKDCTAHHIRFRSHGGGDQAWNLTPPCDDDHIDGIHTGRIRVTGRAPGQLTWYIGREPILVVRGREKELPDR